MDKNAVMDLCMQGMQAEGAGSPAEARRLFEAAWEARQDDFDACIAAHYFARQQITVEARVEWNERALAHADAVLDDRARRFYPSLYLNLATAYEELTETEHDYEDVKRSRKFFALAAEHAADLPPGPLPAMIEREAAVGIRRADALLGPRAEQE